MGPAAATIPYCGPAPGPSGAWQHWNLDPLLLIALALLAVWGMTRPHGPRRGAVGLAWLALAVAFVSPLCALTTALFSARALHHLVLLCVVAPALAVARPFAPLPAAGALPAVGAALLLWHVPAVYSAAWGEAGIYWALQLALVLPGWALWSALLRPSAGLAPVLAVGGLAGVMGLIGAVLTFAPRPLYPEHLAGPLLWGLDPLADQQLAGLVMWVPGMLPLGVLTALLLRRLWLTGEPA